MPLLFGIVWVDVDVILAWTLPHATSIWCGKHANKGFPARKRWVLQYYLQPSWQFPKHHVGTWSCFANGRRWRFSMFFQRVRKASRTLLEGTSKQGKRASLTQKGTTRQSFANIQFSTNFHKTVQDNMNILENQTVFLLNTWHNDLPGPGPSHPSSPGVPRS